MNPWEELGANVVYLWELLATKFKVLLSVTFEHFVLYSYQQEKTQTRASALEFTKEFDIQVSHLYDEILVVSSLSHIHNIIYHWLALSASLTFIITEPYLGKYICWVLSMNHTVYIIKFEDNRHHEWEAEITTLSCAGREPTVSERTSQSCHHHTEAGSKGMYTIMIVNKNRQQTITWTSIGQVPWCHMASPFHGSTRYFRLLSHFSKHCLYCGISFCLHQPQGSTVCFSWLKRPPVLINHTMVAVCRWFCQPRWSEFFLGYVKLLQAFQPMATQLSLKPSSQWQHSFHENCFAIS